MANFDDEFKFESLQDRESIAKYLEALKDGILKGKIILGNAEKTISLEPKGLLNLEVKAKRRNDKVKLTIRCNWKDDLEMTDSDNMGLIIES